MGFFAWLKGVFGRKDKRPFSMGLALGSGGAKGMAHLGALKAFEEAGISFDIVTGTSIGSIVGALYAKGYTSADMKGIVAGLSMREYSRNLRPYADLGFAESLLETYLEGEFSDLNKPFACWATDGDSNEGVLLNSGKIARALIASSAIPPFFRGVDLGDKKLYDGAFTNAVPADVCRNMGADFVVGIDLSAFSRTQEERGAISRLLGSALGAIMPVHYTDDCKSRGYENSDVMLKPNLREFRATDISASAMERMFELGYEEASAHMVEIKSAIAEARKKPRDRKEK